MRYGKSLNSGFWGTIPELEYITLDKETRSINLSNNTEATVVPGEFSLLNETLNIIENVASFVSEYKDPSSSMNPFNGDSWALALLEHMREVAIGHFDKIEDYSKTNTIGKYRDVLEVQEMFNQALKNSFNSKIENPEFIKQVLKFSTNEGCLGKMLGEFLQ
jgi:hypothetical protein